MGNKQHKQVTQRQSLSINHPRFQKCHSVSINGHTFIQIDVPVYSEKEVTEWEKNLKGLAGLNTENLILQDSHTFEKEGMCGTSGIVRILYENYPYLLADQIENRRGLQKRFQQVELWYLLFTIISTAKDFQARGTKVGDIRPQNIFINQDGQVKIANIYSFPGQQANYFKSLLSRDTVTYLAPQEVKQLETSSNNPSSNSAIAQSFSIGLTLLDAGLLTNCSTLYNIAKSQFNFQNARGLLDQWNNTNIYSGFLKQIVLWLCEFVPANRKRASEIYKMLLPYEDDIKNLREFSVETTRYVQNYQQQQQPQVIRQFTQQPISQTVESKYIPYYRPPSQIPQVVQQQPSVVQQQPQQFVQYKSPNNVPNSTNFPPQNTTTVFNNPYQIPQQLQSRPYSIQYNPNQITTSYSGFPVVTPPTYQQQFTPQPVFYKSEPQQAVATVNNQEHFATNYVEYVKQEKKPEDAPV